MKKINSILGSSFDRFNKFGEYSTVNSSNSYYSNTDNNNIYNTVKTVDSITVTQTDNDRINTLAERIASDLEDNTSVGYYKILASKYPQDKLQEAVEFTLNAEESGVLRTKKPVYFQGILKNWGFQTKFKKSP